MPPKINSRNKGSKNERNLAKLLESWTGKKFARTPSSGGLNWKNSNAKGDIVCTTEGHYFPFCIEAKSHKEINFIHLLTDNKKVKIREFWSQCKRDADLAKKIPLLFVRFNGLSKDLHFIIFEHCHISLLGISNRRQYTKSIHLRTEDLDLYLMRSDEFFKHIDYKLIRKPIRQWIKAKLG